MNRRVLITLISIIYSAGVVVAQNNNSTAAIERATREYAKQQSYTIDIEIAFIEGYDTPTWQKGTLVIKGDKYKLSYPDEVVLSNGKETYRYSALNNEVVIEPIAKGSLNASPRAYLAIDTDRYNCSLVDKSATQESYKLTNKAAKGVGSEVIIELTNGKISQITIPTSTSSGLAIKVLKTQFGGEIPNSTFEFNPKDYLNIEVIDFRD